MRFISPLLKYVVYRGLSRAGLLRRNRRSGLTVLTYHGVLPSGYESVDPVHDGGLVSAVVFREQLRLLKSHYDVISSADLLSWLEGHGNLPARAVLLTCDDGLLNNLTDMLSVLHDEGLSCLFFITGASTVEKPTMLWYDELYLLLLSAPAGPVQFDDIGFSAELGSRQQRRTFWSELVKLLSQKNAAERQCFLGEVRSKFRLPDNALSEYWDDVAKRRRWFVLTASELRQLATNGMYIGAHTLSHPMLSLSPEELAWAEIADSKKALEKVLGQPVWALAYPFGDPASVTQREVEMAERAGFKCAFLNCERGPEGARPHFAIPRVHVGGDMTLGEFEAHLTGFHDVLKRRLTG